METTRVQIPLCFTQIQIIGGFGSFQHNANPPKAAVVASPSAGPTPHLQPSVWSWAGGAGGGAGGAGGAGDDAAHPAIWRGNIDDLPEGEKLDFNEADYVAYHQMKTPCKESEIFFSPSLFVFDCPTICIRFESI